MAKWLDKAEFVNTNSRIAINRLSSPNNAFSGQQAPTMVTYFHINQSESTRDTGLQNVESLSGDTSSNKFNLIKDVPLYDIPMMDLSMDEDEEGLTSTLDGSFVLPSHMFHPFPEDYFKIDHLNRPFIFRVTSVNYDTPNANGFYRCEFELWSADESGYESLLKSVIGEYTCIFDNIGTANKAIVADDQFKILHKLKNTMYRLRDEYMDKFYDKNYNALMCMRFSYEGYLYDPMLNSFCNKERVFEIDRYGTTDCYLLYEEKRNFHEIEYENSIFDRLANNDLDDIDKIGKYYDEETPKADVSAFYYQHDHRVKYIMCYANEIGVFGNKLKVYLPNDFTTALELRNTQNLTDPYELFVANYMLNSSSPQLVKNNLELVEKRRFHYDFHSYIFIPMIIYCLKQCYNSILCDTSIMDEKYLDDYTINTKGGKM